MTEGWKRRLIKSVGLGMGFAVALAAILGAGLWYATRPAPPKPWNQTAVATGEPPGFSVTEDGKQIKFYYQSVENTTKTDYRIESDAQIRVMVRRHDGTLSLPIPAEEAPLQRPVFIPARQKGTLTLSLGLSDIPVRKALEDDHQYHERVRAYLQQGDFGQVDGFVLFDELNRYQINLPRWSAEPPKKIP